jgi:hypothetical protein
MQELPRKRFLVFLSLKNDQGRLDTKACDTMQEVNDFLSQERHTATGYAVLDREKQDFIKKKNLF